MYFHLGFIAFYTGDWAQARHFGDRAVALLGQIGPSMNAGNGTLILGLVSYADIEIRQGQPAAARDRLLPLLGEPRAEGRDIAFPLPRLAWAHLELEEPAAALRVADEAVAYARAKGRLLHVYRQMHLQRSDPEPARKRLEEALAIFQRLGARKDAERVERAIAEAVGETPDA